MSYIEVGTVDKLEVSNEYITVDVTTDNVDVRNEHKEVGVVDSYEIAPFNSIRSLEYILPTVVTNTIVDIADIRDNLLTKLNGQEVASIVDIGYTDQFNYNPSSGGTIREQLLTEIDAKYISNGPAGNAHILSFDYTSAGIDTVYDSLGNLVYERASFLDLQNDIVATKAGQASVLEVQNAISSWNNSYATTITNLNATYEGLAVNVTNQAFAFSGGSKTVLWQDRNATDPVSGIKVASGGDVSYNTVTGDWYVFIGGSFGPFNDGWEEYEGSTIYQAALTKGTFTESTTAPLNPNRFDIWKDPSTPSITYNKPSKVYQYSGYNAATEGFGWEEIDPSKPAIGWMGGMSRLIFGPNNAVTGWSAVNGEQTGSRFRINADTFEISNAASTHTPFVIEGSDIKFQGKVTLAGLGIDSDTTTINGDKIKSGTLKSNDVATSGQPISQYDLDIGTITIRDLSGVVRVKLGKL